VQLPDPDAAASAAAGAKGLRKATPGNKMEVPSHKEGKFTGERGQNWSLVEF